MHRLTAFHLALAVIAVIGFSSCGDTRSDPLPEGGSPPGAKNDDPGIVSIPIANLDTHESGLSTYNGELFTGRAFELAGDESRRKEYYYSKGSIVSGREWYSNGGSKFDRLYKNGQPEGPALEWDENGNVEQVLFRGGRMVERKPGGNLNKALN